MTSVCIASAQFIFAKKQQGELRSASMLSVFLFKHSSNTLYSAGHHAGLQDIVSDRVRSTACWEGHWRTWCRCSGQRYRYWRSWSFFRWWSWRSFNWCTGANFLAQTFELLNVDCLQFWGGRDATQSRREITKWRQTIIVIFDLQKKKKRLLRKYYVLKLSTWNSEKRKNSGYLGLKSHTIGSFCNYRFDAFNMHVHESEIQAQRFFSSCRFPTHLCRFEALLRLNKTSETSG